ncbi:GHH signature containing HNH/Endo VII superfamily nuclease toxin 2 [compost metagenome]
MDVKFEGENVVRHMDLTTHNHGSNSNTAPWTYADRMSFAEGLSACDGERKRATADDACGKDLNKKPPCPDNSKIKDAEAARQKAKDAAGKKYKRDPEYLKQNALAKKEYGNLAQSINNDKCHSALRCFLTPYSANHCCPGQTPDHLIDAASFGPRDSNTKIEGWSKYSTDAAPCICAEGPNQTTATHGQLHTRRGVVARRERNRKGQWSRARATHVGAKAAKKTFPASQCSQECLEAQLNKYHDKVKDDGKEKPIQAKSSMTRDESERSKATTEMFDSASTE